MSVGIKFYTIYSVLRANWLIFLYIKESLPESWVTWSGYIINAFKDTFYFRSLRILWFFLQCHSMSLKFYSVPLIYLHQPPFNNVRYKHASLKLNVRFGNLKNKANVYKIIFAYLFNGKFFMILHKKKLL